VAKSFSRGPAAGQGGGHRRGDFVLSTAETD